MDKSIDRVYSDTQWGLYATPGHIDGVKAGYLFLANSSQKIKLWSLATAKSRFMPVPSLTLESGSAHHYQSLYED